MSNAPEKIEACAWWNGATHFCRHDAGGKDVEFEDTEYIRADLAPQWQPIETAPKDGALVILATNTNGSYGVFAPCEWSLAGEVSEEGFWLWWQNEPEWLTEVKRPTHWMPLPEPPK